MQVEREALRRIASAEEQRTEEIIRIVLSKLRAHGGEIAKARKVVVTCRVLKDKFDVALDVRY
jgi:hypothetical protein